MHYFVHLNLAISLLLGYVVFMFGIELGTSTRVWTKHHTTFSQYRLNANNECREVVGLWQHCCSTSSCQPSAGWCVRGSCSTSCWLLSSANSPTSGGSFCYLDTVSHNAFQALPQTQLYRTIIVILFYTAQLSKSLQWWILLPRYPGTPLLFVIIGLASRAEYYGVYGDDGELALWVGTILLDPLSSVTNGVFMIVFVTAVGCPQRKGQSLLLLHPW